MSSEVDDSIKDALNIKEELSVFSKDEKPSADEEKFKQKLENIQKMKDDIKARQKSGDEDYVKQALREVMEIGLQTSRTLQTEVEAHAEGRAVECLAAALNAVTAAAKELQEVEVKKEKNNIARESNEIKKALVSTNGNQAKLTQNNNFFGTPGDILEMMKKIQGGNVKTIEADKD
jgi:cytochrome c556